MADDENTLGAEAAPENSEAAAPEDLVGRIVRIKPEAQDVVSGGAHMWAGQQGRIARPGPFGGWMVQIGRKFKQFSLEDLDLLAEEQPSPEVASQSPTSTPAARTVLVEEPPLAAINSPTNPRKRRGLDLDSLSALAASIRAQGLAQPILVRPLPATRLAETVDLDPRPGYEVVAGERRWRAAQFAELATMPMLVRDLSDEAVLEIQLVENIEREDLDAMEEAEGFALLRDKLGYTVDQIAERIGRGKGASYVRKTMKLLDLTPESREAMYEGHLGRSTGLLVARYPAERQAAVVAFIKSMAVKTPRGTDPAPFRTVAPALHSRFHLALGEAAFDIEDADLLPEAGACSTCPKRTGQAQDLFGDEDNTVDAHCTDDACFAAKKAAHVQRIHVVAKSEGLTVIDGDEALKARPYPYGSYLRGYTSVTDTCRTVQGEDGKELEVTFEDALRGMGRKAPKPMMFIDPHSSEAIKVIPDELAEKLRPARETEEESEREPYVDTRPPEEVAWKSDPMVRRAALFRAFDVIRSSEARNCAELRRTALALLGGCMDDVLPRLEDYLGWSGDLREADDAFALVREKVMAMGAEELGHLVAMASLEMVLTTYPHDENAPQVLAEYGIDLLAVRDKVSEDLLGTGGEGGDEEEDEPASDDGQVDEEASA